MSPPTVNLAKKEPLEATFSELPLEKAESTETPSVITIDVDRRARILRQQRQKRCRIIACTVTLLVVALVAAAVTVTLIKVLHKHRRYFTVPSTSKQEMAHVNVDDDKKLIHTSHVSNDKPTVVIEILHEYTRHLVAYKDMTNSTCYIDRLDETFEVGYERWEAYESNGRDQKALKVLQPIEVEVLQHIGDIHIYGHCSNGDSYWAMEVEEKEVTTEVSMKFKFVRL